MFDIKKIKRGLVVFGLLAMTMEVGCVDTNSTNTEEVDMPSPSANTVSERPMLSVQVRRDTSDRKIRIADIVFTKQAETKGPRVAEIFLKYSEGLTYVSSAAGAALGEADKTLVAQNPENGKLRLIAFGADNTNAIDGGVLASVVFKSETSNTHTVEILTQRPIFAPQDSNDGLLVSDPVVVE